MAIFKIITRKGEKNYVKLYERLNYILNAASTRKELIYGQFVSTVNPYPEMMLAKKSNMDQKGGWNPFQGVAFYEAVVSLSLDDDSDVYDLFYTMVEINQMFSNYNGDHYQVLSSVHINTDNLHVHFVVNNTDFITGKRFSNSESTFYDIVDHLNCILKRNGYSLIDIDTGRNTGE